MRKNDQFWKVNIAAMQLLYMYTIYIYTAAIYVYYTAMFVIIYITVF